MRVEFAVSGISFGLTELAVVSVFIVGTFYY
jgi:hypothetical protein